MCAGYADLIKAELTTSPSRPARIEDPAVSLRAGARIAPVTAIEEL